MTEQQIALLLYKYMQNTLNEAETQILEQWRKASIGNSQLFDEMTDEQGLSAAVAAYHPEIKRTVEAEVFKRIKWLISDLKPVPIYRRAFFRVSVAASIILAIAFGGYKLLTQQSFTPDEVAQTGERRDVEAPKTTKAMIVLADGKKISIHHSKKGLLAEQANVKLVKAANGHISYLPIVTTNGKSDEMPFNTLLNPRGSRVINITLADGSRVWLNAGSSITYPIAFTGKERNVTLNGEAYFEVTHDAAAPFKVSKGDMTVEVLGTHFNVNTYHSENDSNKVTLLEGSVQVTLQNRRNGNAAIKIKPGEEAVVTANGIEVNHSPAIEKATAWLYNKFIFYNEDLQSIVWQLSAWYDIEPVFIGNVGTRRYSGELSMDLPLSKILEMLERTSLEVNINGKKVTIKGLE